MFYTRYNNVAISALIVTLLLLCLIHKEIGAIENCVDTRLRPGSCTTLAACPLLIEEFYDEARTSTYLDFQTFIGSSMCGFDGSEFLICCTNRSARRPARAQPIPPSVSAQNYTSYLPYSTSELFYFAPLSGTSTPPIIYPTTSTNTPAVVYPTVSTYIPPIIYPTASTNTPAIIYPSSPSQMSSAPPIVLQPTPYRPTPPAVPTAPTPSAYQPIPSNPPLPSQPPPRSAAGCGISRGTTNRVVGGSEAKRAAYPWVVALGYRDEYDRNTMKYLCAGSLISSTYVLTSAHCINPSLTLVRLGAHDLSNPSEQGAINVGIRSTKVHEQFNLKSIANDIALVELSSAAPMTDYIGTICLPESSTFLTQDFVGMHPFIAGWGAANHQGPTSNVLRDVQVPIVNRQTCEQTYRSVFQFIEFSSKLICAGNSNVDACQGDSGGPLMLPQSDGSIYRYYLLGIVSYGYECARTGFPGVYTRVASYMSWIRSHTV